MLPRRWSGRGAAVAGAVLALAPRAAAAHGNVPASPGDTWRHWALEPGVILGIALAAWLYARGIRRLWADGHTGRVVSPGRAAGFAAGLATLVIALVSPLDPLSDVLFSAHMTQHLLLTLVAAPLLVRGAPEAVLLWGLPVAWRGRAGHWWARLASRHGQLGPGIIAVASATLALWVWHLPRLYDLAVANETVHALEHLSFLLTAAAFWATVLRLQPRARLGNGLRIVAIFVMAVQGSVLGALITFSTRPLYLAHAQIPTAWGLTPLADQQLAGLIMWIPPAFLYIAVAATLFVHWLGAVGERVRERELRAAAAQARVAAGTGTLGSAG